MQDITNLKDHKWCFLDLETTGFSATDDSIIEISYLVFQGETCIAKLDQVVVPEKSSLSDIVTQITGITQTEIDTNGVTFESLKTQIQADLNGAIIVGHNIDFDTKFLIENGIQLDPNIRVDTHELARIILPGEESYALEILSKKFGFIHENAHRAMSDVVASKDLFYLLHEKTKQLPASFLEEAKNVLETKSIWFTKSWFTNNQGANTQSAPTTETAKSAPQWELPEKISQTWQHTSDHLALRIGQSVKSAKALSYLASKRPNSLIVSPKLDYFTTETKIPTPEVIFSKTRFDTWHQSKTKLNNQDTTFYLQALHRHHLGSRGLWNFDLFFLQRDIWNEVNLQSVHDQAFQEILKSKTSDQPMLVTPTAFWQLEPTGFFKDKALLIDESESFADLSLKAVIQTDSLKLLLNSGDETISVAAQFLVRNIVRDIVEPTLGHNVGPFPVKIPLKPSQSFERLAAAVLELNPQLKTASEVLNPTKQTSIRWIEYHPESGNVTFNQWLQTDWLDQLKKLNQHPVLWAHRHKANADQQGFLRTFLTDKITEFFEVPDLTIQKKIFIPQNLVAQSSPDYNAYCANIIQRISKKSQKPVMAYFGSLDSLRNINEFIGPWARENQVHLLGEKVSGGNGKVRQILGQKQNEPQLIFLAQKIQHPDLSQTEWGNLVIQKFPFGPPHPVLEFLENQLKSQGLNFFEWWVIPTVAANLSRNTSNCPTATNLTFLDSRQNAPWGKQVLRLAFD